MKISGIYQIQSKIKPERIYIGSAMDIDRRWKEHKRELKGNYHLNRRLQGHVNKYTINDLVFSTLCTCEKDQLIQFEQYYLDFYHPTFNICLIAGSNLGYHHTEEAKNKIRLKNLNNKYSLGYRHTIETKQKMSMSRLNIIPSDKTRQKMSIWQIGKKLSIDTKQKISKAQKGNKNFLNKHHTEEAKNKMKIKHQLIGTPWSCKPILQFDKQGNFIREWDSTADVKRNLFIDQNSISSCLYEKHKTAGGFIWKFKFEIKKIA